MTRRFAAFVALASLALATDPNPLGPVEHVNRLIGIDPGTGTPRAIEFDSAIIFKNDADRSALATLLGAGGVDENATFTADRTWDLGGHHLTITGGVTATTFTGALTGNASTATAATALATGRTLSITGDLAYTSPSFDGSGNVTAAGTLANTAVTAASYGSATAVPGFTVDAKGRLTAAGNVTISIPATAISDGTTVGRSLMKLSNPTAKTYIEIESDNSVITQNAATHLAALGGVSLTGNNTLTGSNTVGDLTAGANIWNLSGTTVNVTGAMTIAGGGALNYTTGPGFILDFAGGESFANHLPAAQLPSHRNTVDIYTDFLSSSGTDGFSSSISGTSAGASAFAAAVAGHPGLRILTTGTTSTGRAAIVTETSISSILLGAGAVYFEINQSIPTLSNGTDTFTYRAGILQSISGESTDGVFFRYTDSVDSGHWQGVCRAAGTETVADLTDTVNAGQYDTLRFEVNAAATSVTFYVNGVSRATTTTHIPTSVAATLGSFILKSVGTTARSVNLDYIHFHEDMTVAR